MDDAEKDAVEAVLLEADREATKVDFYMGEPSAESDRLRLGIATIRRLQRDSEALHRIATNEVGCNCKAVRAAQEALDG